jgi:hypothetical protein
MLILTPIVLIIVLEHKIYEEFLFLKKANSSLFEEGEVSVMFFMLIYFLG